MGICVEKRRAVRSPPGSPPSKQEEKGSQREICPGSNKQTKNHCVLHVPAGTGCLKRTKLAQSTTAGGLPTVSSAEVILPGDALTEIILSMMVPSLHKSEKIRGGPIGHPETRAGLVPVLSLGKFITCSQTLGLFSFCGL